MAEVRVAKSGIRPIDRVVVKEITVVGNQKFMVNSPNFIISPISKEALLYINSCSYEKVDFLLPFINLFI